MKTNQKQIEQEKFLKHLDRFIRESSSGKRSRKDGKVMKHDSVNNYIVMRNLLINFSKATNFSLEFYLINKLSKNELNRAKRYWKSFFFEFTEYLYKKRNCHDNYVQTTMKNLKTFLNYLKSEHHINLGDFHKSIHVPNEKTPIYVLSPSQLSCLIYDKKTNNKIPDDFVLIRDIFIVGCTVALRYSDLIAIRPENVYYENNTYYLKVISEKTNTSTSIQLPPYVISIIKKYENKKRKTIFPYISNEWFNIQLKKMLSLLDMNEQVMKFRSKRGVRHVIYKCKETKEHYTLADHFSSHAMRRTAITTMLRMGVPEQVVRKISGHAPNSAEFYKYVEFAQGFLDEHTGNYYAKMKNLPINKKSHCCPR